MDPSPMATHGYQLTASSTSASTDASTSSIQRVREQSLLLRRGQWDLWPESTVALGSLAWRWSLTSQRRSGPGEVRCNFFLSIFTSLSYSLSDLVPLMKVAEEHGQTAGGIGSLSPSRCHRSSSICTRLLTPPPTVPASHQGEAFLSLTPICIQPIGIVTYSTAKDEKLFCLLVYAIYLGIVVIGDGLCISLLRYCIAWLEIL